VSTTSSPHAAGHSHHTPASDALHARRVGAVARGVGSVLSTYVESAGGGTLTDVDGREWIDFAAGIAVTTVGNSAPLVVQAVRDQVARFTHTCFMVAPYEPYVAVCEALNGLTPGGFDKRSALFNSGAEAVENAVKIARYATGRRAVVVFDHAYHGRTNLTMAMTAKDMPYRHGFGPFAPEVYRVPMSYPFRDGLTGTAAAARAIDAIGGHVGAEEVAALVIEPIQGEGGFVVPALGFLPELAGWAAEHGVLFVADEIQTGFCRTGDWFASQHEGLEPDLVATAKGIAGGLPLSGITGRAAVLDSVHVGGLGGTYGGNPVACAAALASIETMRVLDLNAAAHRIGASITDRLARLAATHPQIGSVRGRGAMIAAELVVPGTTEPDAALTAAVSRACHRAGLLTLTCGTDGNVMRFLPPLVIDAPTLERGLDILESAFASTLA
jgi:4-aminobutyrate aminotransferase/(S)-3-amino-2-methylpropionate transaminase